MIEYFITNTSITIELIVLSGGTTVTGRTPYAEIRNKDTGQYFDFNSRTFTGTTVSSTAPLASAIDGLYQTTWDVSGLFTAPTFLMFEYHDDTALAIDDVLFTRPPLSTGDVSLSSAGGSVTIRGIFNETEKKKLFDTLDEIRSDLKDFREQAMMLIRGIFNREPMKREDIEFLKSIKERDEFMWQELLKILKMRNDATVGEIIEKLEEYTEREEEDKKKVLKFLEEKLRPSKIDDDPELVNLDDDGDE